MKQINTYEAIKAYQMAKSAETMINDCEHLNFKSCVVACEHDIGFYIYNNKDHMKAVLEGIDAIQNKSLVACLDFSYPDEYDITRDIEEFKGKIRVLKKVLIRSIDL